MSQLTKPTDLHAPGAIEQLIAYWHSVAGDARMDGSESTDTGAGGESASQEGDDNKEGAEGAEGDDKGSKDGAAGDGDDDKDDLPEAVKKKLTKANNEAARYRTQLREAEDKLKDAKTPEEVEAIVKEMTEAREASELALLRENVALKAKLPPELAQRLQGATREELEADAKALAKFAEKDEDPDLSGGLNPSEDGDDGEMDPAKLAAKYGPRRRR